MKLTARLTEAEAAIDNLTAKLNQVEKAKGKIGSEISEMTSSLDQAQVLNAAMERKAKQFDKTISEYKGKGDRLSYDLDVSQKETRNASSEQFKVKSAYEETMLQLEEVRKENKTLSNEIKDIMDQISEGGRSIHEIDKIRKRLEAEKMELQAALEEAEGALEQEENKVLRSQLELSQVRQEIERRIAEKDEEFQSTRKNFTKAVDGMETALEHANAANGETQKTIKKYHGSIRDAQAKLEDEQRAKEVTRDGLLANERKANTTQNALEEARTLLEQSDRVRRITEQELSDTNEQLSELTCQNQAIAGAKRKLESEMQTLHGDLDEMSTEASLSEEKAKKAMVDAARLAEELRGEQDLAAGFERERKLLECQVKDCATRLDDAEANALKGGKKAMNKMETRIRELESEVDAEQRRMGDSIKNLSKSERRIKEMSYATDEDRKNHERMQALVDQLQSKIKTYKKQIEEAEEIAALNLAKFRGTQAQVADSAELADLNEKALAKAKAKARGASVAL